MNSGVIYGLERGEEKGRLCNGLERRGQEENYSYLFKIARLFSFKLRLV